MISGEKLYKVVFDKGISIDKWWDYLDHSQNATVFHTPWMHEAYNYLNKYTSFALFVIDDNEAIVGMMNGYIQRLIPVGPTFLSTRSVIMQSPLFNNNNVLRALLQAYSDKFGNRVLYSEIRNHIDLSASRSVFEECGFVFEDHLNIIIDLTQSEDELWKQVHSKRRNEIKKAIKSNLLFRELENVEINEAYEILTEVYNRAKLPLLSLDFFHKLSESNSKNCRLCVYGAFSDKQIVGTMFTLQYKKKMYDFFAGSYSRFYHLNPNDLIPWCVFIEGKRRFFEVFDFGGAGKPNVPYGVREYKKKFGGTSVNYGRYKHTSYNYLFRFFVTAMRSIMKKRN